MWGKMIKNIALTLFFAIVTYAIVSDLGKTQHSYRVSYPAAVVN